MEKWLPVVAYEGLYEISDRGRVRRNGRLLRDSELNGGKGYRKVTLCRSAADHRTHLVHRLVLLAFVGEPPAGHETNHKNTDRADNRLGNLEWLPQAVNAYEPTLSGRRKAHYGTGSSNHFAKLTPEQVSAIRVLKGSASGGAVAARYNVGPGAVYRIWRGESWTHL